MTCGNLNHDIGFVAQNHVVGVWVDGGPASEKDGVLEHGLDTLFLEAPLLVKQKRSSNSGAFGIANDGIKGTTLVHDFEQVFECVVGTAMRGGDALAHQLSHGVFRALTIGKVPNSGQDVIVFGLFHILVGLDEAIIRGFSKVLLEALGRHGFTGTVDEVEGSRSIISQFLDDGC